MSRRALTGNAADRHQVEYADRRERRRAAMFAQALQATLATAEGRALLWCLIEKAGVFRSVWENTRGFTTTPAARTTGTSSWRTFSRRNRSTTC